ncbi:monovalent cation/H+ antiporter subunit A [Reinekea blandensis]|uniref:NADH:ubiquinone oxidoreductase subunit 5 n=1 Tax=Reinekea blandensis MED297 TaxID=314283 RepID=A4B981_9GAMM|nr:monovalent cation/H+ antiporter subunit A [Reinekea blandensis]EAR11182.1 NADH:ubiquinone oxidoreductase subunit 5 [Reinekea sp. MED297] [Reinekea blandensis MED297]
MSLYWVPLLTFIGSLVPLIAGRLGRSGCAALTALFPAIALALIASHIATVFDGQTVRFAAEWVPKIGLDISFRLDGLALLFALLILGIGLLVILYARYYLSEKDAMGRFYSFLMLFMTAMLGIVLSNNLLQMWFFWELTSLSSFLLISYWHHRSDARKGARMALTITGAGGLALLAGIVLIGQLVGSYDLDIVLASGDLIRGSEHYLTILVLVLLGAFTKSAQFPFHFWLPHAMAAPTPVSAYLHSATMVKAGIFLMARLYPVLAGTEAWFLIVSITGLLTLLIGAYMALFKHDLKGLLAYSTVSHLGLITLLLGMGTQLAAVAAVFHIINHATFKASLFMAAGIIDHESGSRDMRQLNGLWKYMPQTATLAIIASAAMAGVPLLNGFLSKEMFFAETLEQSTLGSISWMVPVFATIGAAFSVAYSLRFIHDVFFNGEPRDLPKVPHEPPRYMRVPVEILVGLCLIVGILPQLTIGELLASASTAVLGGNLPYYKLYIWHGFNLPLMMSIAAMAGGAVLYINRHRLFRFQANFPERNESQMFDDGIKKIRDGIRVFMGWFDNGATQRSVFWLLFLAVAVSIPPLMSLNSTAGFRPQIPVDSVMIAGATLLCVASIATVIWHHQRLLSLLLLSIVGLIVSISFALFSAPDLALTQLSVEVVTIVLLLLALYFLPQRIRNYSSPNRIVRDASLSVLIGGMVGTLTYALMTRPFESISWFYEANAKTLGGGTNIVNVILVDFRGFDTFGEITVLAIAALGIFKLIARMRLYQPHTDPDGIPWAPDKHPIMFQIISQALLPLALMVSFYIFLRGHNLPGGGFIAGLITSIAIIQQYIARGYDFLRDRINVNYLSLIGSGLLIAFVTGVGSFLWQQPFLKSWHDYIDFPLIGEVELASAMAFDLGVYLTVVGASMLILANLGGLTTTDRLREEEE